MFFNMIRIIVMHKSAPAHFFTQIVQFSLTIKKL